MKNLDKIITGTKGEKIASAFLKKNGYKILETNFRCSLGEIDIVAREKEAFVFVEVKTRKSDDWGYPEQAVSVKKQKKLSQLALAYFQKNNLADVTARFDVIAITLSNSGSEIKLIQNAFDLIEQ